MRPIIITIGAAGALASAALNVGWLSKAAARAVTPRIAAQAALPQVPLKPAGPAADTTTATAVSLVGGLGVGLVAGIITGFYFERRATRNTRQQNAELRKELGVLKTTIYSLGARREEASSVAQAMASDLASLVTARALNTQDAAGRVDRRDLITYFLERGNDVSDVEAAISTMESAGAAREEGQWLQLP